MEDRDLDALLETFASASGDDQSRAAWAALAAVGYVERAPICPLPEELSPAQLLVCRALALVDDLALGNHAIPQTAALRRRWLGIDPPTILERRVSFTRGNETVSWPLWRVWRELQTTGREDDIPRTVPDDVERLAASVETWLDSRYGLDGVKGVIELVDGLGARAAAWAEPFVEEIAAVAALRPFIVDWTCRVAGLVPLVRAGRVIEERWEHLVPLMEHPFLLELVEALPPERRDDVLVERLDVALTGSGLMGAMAVLERHPLPKLALATDALQKNKSRTAGFGAERRKAWKARWNALLAAQPGLLPGKP